MSDLKIVKDHEQAFSSSDRKTLSSFQQISESEIWKRFKEGNEAAFNYIYQQYFPVLFNYGQQFTRDRELIKDLIQDLFIDLKEKRKKLKDTTSIKFYLYKSLRRRIIRYHGNNRLASPFHDAYHSETGFEIVLSSESKLIHTQINEELKYSLEKALENLTKRQKEIIIYFYFEGLSYKEITSIMGFSKVEYARVLVSRSIARLRETMKQYKNTFFLFLLSCFG